MTDFNIIPRAERVIVALDCDRSRAFWLAEELKGHASWLKIGMTLYYQEGPQLVRELQGLGYKVFLDLKFHDIPHQVRGAARAAAESGADMMTMHAQGGVEMMQAALAGVAEAKGANNPITLAVTVLTSMNDDALAAIGVERPIEEQVRALALMAKQAGLTGVVASPLEASMLREVLGPEAAIVTPGVRPAGSALGDQSRVTTPKQAFDNGASHIVIGRPVTENLHPVAAFDAIAADL